MKTLAIIGSHPRTREQFDFTREADVWLFNEALSNKNNVWAKRADAVFQMHVPVIWKNPNNRNDPHHFEWLQNQHDCVVYMQEQYAEVPESVRYPKDEILDMLGDRDNHFLTSSVPQAMALAAYLGIYNRVEIYGVAMETNTEYQFQREGVSFWLGYLKGKGIDVYFADPTFHAPLYGYEGEVFIKYERFAERIAELTPNLDAISGQYRAAKSALLMAVNAFIDDSNRVNEDVLAKCVANIRVLGEQMGTFDGAIQENERYKRKADDMLEKAETFVFSRQEFESGATTYRDKLTDFQMKLNSLGTTLEHVHANVKNSAKGSPKRKKYADMYREILEQFLQLQNWVGIMRGVSGENFNYMSYLDKHIKAAGGSKSEEAIINALV